ncbi:SemiSWEET transporter [Synechococcus sp. Nb3U1]|uniref:SemiSWEET family sugar transporter n=1 Tax=Synechococcus sp. Nb3U1 TaxID=1914529 RepID=UPI001F42EEB1|nr:SemiSWEET transporter [Synechococcus sp. Nb3U1]MCF2969958.1 SemiSWEET transporter [Synechococcus sp. Nb3U1]
MNLTLWIGLVAATLTTSSFFPQAWKTWRSQRADDFSWSYLLLFGVGILMWDLYGLLRRDTAITLANTMTLALVGVIILTKFRSER